MVDFENYESFVIPFCISETSAWKKVIHYLSEKETTPVETACKSRLVSIVKEYYPVERLEVNCTIKWSAVSIYIERWTEQETHYEQQVHYFDRFGQEHDRPGFDYYDVKAGRWKSGAVHFLKSGAKGLTGDPHSKPWDPREVTVAVTEDIQYEKEIGRKRTDGEYGSPYNYYHDTEYPFPQIMTEFSVRDSGKKIPYSREAIKDGVVIGQAKPFTESDFTSSRSDAKSQAEKSCIGQIPGQRYADLRMEFVSEDICEIWYYPVYHISYEFMGQNYECFVAGHQEVPVKGKHDPEDVSFKSAKQQYDKMRSDLVDREGKGGWGRFFVTLYGYGFLVAAIGGIPLVLIMTLFGSTAGDIFIFILIGVYVYLVGKSLVNIKAQKELKQGIEASKDSMAMRQRKKKAIADVMLNDNLSESEKIARCDAILNNRTNY